MTQQPANITVTAQLADGKDIYWARVAYQVVPHGPGQFLFTPKSYETLSEVDEDLEALTKGLAVSPLPPPPDGVENHLELESIVWNTKDVHDKSQMSFTLEGAQKVKKYVLEHRAQLFPALPQEQPRPSPLGYRFSMN